MYLIKFLEVRCVPVVGTHSWCDGQGLDQGAWGWGGSRALDSLQGNQQKRSYIGCRNNDVQPSFYSLG